MAVYSSSAKYYTNGQAVFSAAGATAVSPQICDVVCRLAMHSSLLPSSGIWLLSVDCCCPSRGMGFGGLLCAQVV